MKPGDSRTDFYAMYNRESGEFDKGLMGKYDADLTSSLTFVSDLISKHSLKLIPEFRRLVSSLDSLPPSSSISNQPSS